MGSLARKRKSGILLTAVAIIVLAGLLAPFRSATATVEEQKLRLLERLGLDRSDSMVIQTAREAQTLYGVEVLSGESGDTVVIQLSGLPEYKSYIFGEDRRLVVDLQNTVDISSRPQLSAGEETPFRRIRTSQYKVDPSLVARVVVELNGTAVPEITSEGTNLVISASASKSVQPTNPMDVSGQADEIVMVPSVKVNTEVPKIDYMLAYAGMSHSASSYTFAANETLTYPEAETAATPAPSADEFAAVEPQEGQLSADLTIEQPASPLAGETIEAAREAEQAPAEAEEQIEPVLQTIVEAETQEAPARLVLAANTAPVEAPSVVSSDPVAEQIPAPAHCVKVAKSESQPTTTSDQVKPATSEAPVMVAMATTAEQTQVAQAAAQPASASAAPAKEAAAKPEQRAVTATEPVAAPPIATPAELPVVTVSGDKLVTLIFRDADLSAVLDILARQGNLNILAGSDVKGTVTVRLVDVPLETALNAILNVNGYGFVKVNNIVRILPLSKLGGEVQTVTETFVLSYADAAKAKTTLQKFLTPTGSIETDQRTNMLIVTDIPGNMDRVRTLIPQIDKRVQQVLIEVLILDSVLSDDADLGIQWNAINDQDSSPNTLSDARVTDTNDSVNVLLPRNVNGLNLSLGTILGDVKLNVLIEALVDAGNSKVLANPKILTLNNEKASIEIITEFPYNDVTQTSSGGQLSNITFKEVGTKLEVKPQITHDGHVILHIKPEQNFVSDISSIGVPIVDTRRAETTLIVKDQQTIVLGGLRLNSQVKNVSKVPFLGDLPVAKYIFRSVESKKRDSELLVFITVRIVESAPILMDQKLKFDELANIPRKPDTSIDLIR